MRPCGHAHTVSRRLDVSSVVHLVPTVGAVTMTVRPAASVFSGVNSYIKLSVS